MTAMRREPQRVLIYRLGSLGDHAVALPCYRLVARAFPHAERRLLTNFPVAQKAAAAEAVIGASGLIDGYMSYTAGERDWRALLRLAREIRGWRPDVLVYLAGARGLRAARRDAWFFRLCGARQIVGLPSTAELQANLPQGEREGVPWFESEAGRLARCIAELGDARLHQGESWSPGLVHAEYEAAARLTLPFRAEPYLAVSLGTKVQSNQWGEPRWQELLARLAATWPGHGLAVLGAPDERERSEQLAAAWRAVPGAGPALNLCGECAPRVSAAVMERAAMFLGHDSGPAHMAAAVGVPVTAVYGSRMLPGTWTPRGESSQVLMHWPSCGGCQLAVCIEQGKRCLESIGVDEVFGAVNAALRQGMPRDHLRVLDQPAADAMMGGARAGESGC